MIDYTRLLQKLDPQVDGEDVTRLRKGVVDAVNADGTVDLVISGIVIPGVPVLKSAVVSVDQVVQVLTSRGSLLVLGAVSAADEPYFVSATSASSNFTTSDATVLQINSVVFRAGRAYRAEFYGGWNDAAGAPTLFNPKIKKTNFSGTLWVDFGWLPMVNGVANITGMGATGLVRRTASTDLTADVVLTAVTNTGTANMFANTTLLRWLEIRDIGRAAKYTNVFDVT
jgi:hypothetical protein